MHVHNRWRVGKTGVGVRLEAFGLGLGGGAFGRAQTLSQAGAGRFGVRLSVAGGDGKPSVSLDGLAGQSASLRQQETIDQLGPGVALARRLAIPARRPGHVGFDPAAVGESLGQQELGTVVAPCRRLAEPIEGELIVLLDAEAAVVGRAQHVFRPRLAALGGRVEPLRCGLVVASDAVTLPVGLG